MDLQRKIVLWFPTYLVIDELKIVTDKILGNEDILVKWNVKLKLVPGTQSTCCKFQFAVTILKTFEKKCQNFSSSFLISPGDLFFDTER